MGISDKPTVRRNMMVSAQHRVVLWLTWPCIKDIPTLIKDVSTW